MSGCELCGPLDRRLAIGRAVSDTNTGTGEEFPEAFVFLAVPGDGLLFFYRHSEARLLTCPGCGRHFHYQSVTTDGRITETLIPADPASLAAELDRLEKTGREWAGLYPAVFTPARLEALLADLALLRR